MASYEALAVNTQRNDINLWIQIIITLHNMVAMCTNHMLGFVSYTIRGIITILLSINQYSDQHDQKLNIN